MTILVINAGSSSVKFTLFAEESTLAEGIIERIGRKGTRLLYKDASGMALDQDVAATDTRQAVERIARLLEDKDRGILKTASPIRAAGHRVVHGGEKLTRPVIVDEEVRKTIRDCFELAPLHNPPNLQGIEVCERHFPDIPQVAVFDTAFHSTMPDYAYLYGIPYDLYRKDGIRRYGFHGISHGYVAKEAARFLERPPGELKLITCHLGNGCSITAVQGGKSVDTSMGFTPLEGLIMGTRCGDLDPAVVLYLVEHKGMEAARVGDLLNKRSGILGLAQAGSNDFRDVIAAAGRGSSLAKTALEAFCYRIKKYIGAYWAAMNGLDGLVFTAGIGENSPLIRQMVCQGLDGRGGPSILLDPRQNEMRGAGFPCAIHKEESSVKVLVVPTNEAKEISRQARELLGPAPRHPRDMEQTPLTK